MELSCEILKEVGGTRSQYYIFDGLLTGHLADMAGRRAACGPSRSTDRGRNEGTCCSDSTLQPAAVQRRRRYRGRDM